MLEKNGYFSVERIDTIPSYMKHKFTAAFLALKLRAIMEELIKEHFGNETVDSVFEYFSMKVAENLSITDEKIQKCIDRFILLKHNIVGLKINCFRTIQSRQIAIFISLSNFVSVSKLKASNFSVCLFKFSRASLLSSL